MQQTTSPPPPGRLKPSPWPLACALALLLVWGPALVWGQLGGRVARPTTFAVGSDPDAIHDNVAGEFVPIPAKPTPVPTDLVLIEDSEAGNQKKRITIGSLPGGGGGDVTTATSLATSFYVGDATLGTCHYTTPEGLVIEAACDDAKTTHYTADIVMFASGPMSLRNANNEICATVDQFTGRTTYQETGACQRPVVSRPFDASAFNVGAGMTLESVGLSGWPGAPVLDGPDSDGGLFSLVIPILWADFAAGGAMTVQLTCHSLTNQNGLTLVVRVGAAVCTADGEALASYVAPTTGSTLTCTFGDQINDVQMSNVVTLAAGGCAAGEKLQLPFVSEVDMTASWSVTTGLITGGLLQYESGGLPGGGTP